jgi:hypothetical protein
MHKIYDLLSENISNKSYLSLIISIEEICEPEECGTCRILLSEIRKINLCNRLEIQEKIREIFRHFGDLYNDKLLEKHSVYESKSISELKSIYTLIKISK